MGGDHEGNRGLNDHERIDDGLKMAFGEPGGSVLDAIEALSGTRSRVLLRDAPEDASPILRVARPAADGAATDDSRYQILGEIARGGIGVICKGRDKDLGRDVALKVLRPEFAGNPDVIARFIEEAQVGGQLQHPGIVPIYSLGLQAGGRPYFAMKLIKGETLTALLQQGRKASDLIGIFERVAQTIAYAHSRGVIHRDLKPSNVMVGAFGEVQVVDWGFAKVLGRAEEHPRPNVTMVATVRSGEDGSQSIAGSVMGTPAYMPPEQALGHIEELTERSDVFALGAILCEILTGKPPYTGTMQDQLLAAAHARLEDAHARLEKRNAPEELKRIVRACLQPLPKDRPENAGVVAQRLANHLASVEERARQADLDAVHAAAAAKREQRKRRATVALAALVLVAVVGAGGGYHAWSKGERARAEAAAAQVAPVMREATRHEGDGRWTEAKAAAANALALAETGGADDETLATVRGVHDRIEAEAAAVDARERKRAREAGLIHDLDELAMQRVDLSAAQLDAGYRAAFEKFGVDVDRDDDTAALADFDRKVELAVHLDAWARVRRNRPGTHWKFLHRLARTLDPDDWRNRLRDTAQANDVEALRGLAASVDAGAQEPASLVWLADALAANDAPEDAVGLLRRARIRHPADYWIHYRLAEILWFTLHRATEARPYAKAAIALRPNGGANWNILGALRNDGLKDYGGALRVFRRAVELEPGVAVYRTNLGKALGETGDIEGAIASCREALRIDPDDVGARNNLGVALQKKGDLDGAIAEYRDTIRIDPDKVGTHANLGGALRAKGDFEGSVEEFRKAAARNPDFRHDLARAERLAAAHARLPAVLRGEDRPSTAGDWLGLAELCYETRDYAASARFWREVFAAGRALAADLDAGHRYNAACSAALAGGEWRAQALAWLGADLDAWRVRSKADPSPVVAMLRHWKRDPDLASVRDTDDLSDEWRELWADVDALLAKAEEAAK